MRTCTPKVRKDPAGIVDQLRRRAGQDGGARLDKQHGGQLGCQAVAAGYLGQHLGQLAGQLDPGGAAAADHNGRQAALPLGIGGGRGLVERPVDRRPYSLGIAGRVQRHGALGQAGDGEVVGPAAQRQHHPAPADRPGAREHLPSGQVEIADLGLDEADPLGQHVLERDAHRVGRAGAGSDPGQLGERLVVVVPVDQGQLHRGVVAQLGRQAQGDVQPGVACPGDHDPAASLGGGCTHGVLQVKSGRPAQQLLDCLTGSTSAAK